MKTVIDQMIEERGDAIIKNDFSIDAIKDKIPGPKDASKKKKSNKKITKRLSNEEVRDGYLGDLPEDLSKAVMKIHKLIVDTARYEFTKPKYDYLNSQKWAQQWLDEFLVEPTDKSDIGAVRVYKRGKKFRCMIQVTAHIENNRDTEDQEFFHGFLRNVHTAVRSKVRREFDMTLTCESEHGEHFEGFDVWTKSKTAKAIWELWEDKQVKVLNEAEGSEIMVLDINDLPGGLQNTILETYLTIEENLGMIPDMEMESVGYTVLSRDADGFVEGYTILTPEMDKSSEETNAAYESVWDDIHEKFESLNPTKALNLYAEESTYFEMSMKPEYAGMLWDYLESNDVQEMDEASQGKLKFDHRMAIDDDTGDRLHIIYSTDNMQLDQNNVVKIHKRKPGEGDTSAKGVADLKKYGNTDHSSSNQKVLAIVDMDTGEKLTRPVKVRGPVGYKTDQPYTIQVGKVDTVSRFKSTYWPKKSKEDEYSMQQIAHNEHIGQGRGVKGHQEFEQNPARMDVNLEFPKWIETDKMHFDKLSGKELKYEIQKRYEKILAKYDADPEKYKPFTKFLNMARNALEADYVTKTHQFTKKPDEYDPAVEDKLRRAATEYMYAEIKMQRSTVYRPYLSNRVKPQKESFDFDESYENTIIWNPYMEGDEYNEDVHGVKDAKRLMGTLSQQIIDGDKEVVQYTANIYANIITKNLLSTWAHGYNRLSIKLRGNSDTLEFRIPKMTNDFVSRFIDGRESLNGFLHREPEITVFMSPSMFKTMKNRDDAFNFFRALIKYYDSGSSKYASSIIKAVHGMDRDLKQLVSVTKLSGLITMPLKMIFTFEDVDMSSKDTFKIKNEDINAISKFIKGIYSSYESPDKEKNKILSDLDALIKHLKEQCEFDDNIRSCNALYEGVNDLYNGKFQQKINVIRDQRVHDNLDTDKEASQVEYMKEKFGVKKLKKFPSDLVAYISIECEAIRSYNDKMMIASYCVSKIDLVEWYIEIIDSGNSHYVVPHTRPYLVNLRTQLLQCYKNIMAVNVEERQRKDRESATYRIPE